MLKSNSIVLCAIGAVVAAWTGLHGVGLEGAGVHGQSAGDARLAPRRVVMISIDGLMPSTYTKPGPSKVPTLRQLARDGAFADGVIGVLPTVTYPSHTTMITGVPPAAHGIYNNTILDPEGKGNGEWYRYARDIQVTTLPGLVKARGLTTAAVSWPVTVGADLDYFMPEVLFHTHPKMVELLRALSSPRHLLEGYEVATGKPIPWPMTDDDRTGLAAWIFKTYRPHLTLLHIYDTDTAQHNFGPGSPEALAAIEQADAHVKQMLDVVSDTGLQSTTDIVIVSDHGFMPLGQQLQLNALFKREGLIDVNPTTNAITRWDAFFYSAGGSGFIVLKNPDDEALRSRVGTLLTKAAADPANGIAQVLDRDALRKLGAEPRASFAVDMQKGFYTNSAHDVLVKPSSSKGGHGFLPTRPELHASLILRGPDVPKSGSLGVVRMTQIAPTLAPWLGVTLPSNVDAPIALAGAAATR
jgi:predicted AlkP superfamily pyrophosphatase or phosphodiesterase